MTHPPGARQAEPTTILLDQALAALAGGGGDLVGHANALGASLHSPPRVVVLGRLKAGKSTLVNALTHNLIAATATLECTNAVTVFHDGAPARAEVVGLDGTRTRIDLVDGVLTELGRPVQEVSHVDRFLPVAALRQLTLVDTPGIATLTVENADATRRALIDGEEQTARASVDTDAAVFLFDSTPHADEVDFLAKLGFTPLNTIGVLSRADGFGEGTFGRRDPLEHARAHADVLARQLHGRVGRVLPVSGLMAESCRTGQVTNSLARSLRSLAGLGREELLDQLELEQPTRVSAAERDALLDVLGEYGVMHGARVAAEGGAVALTRWMEERSGIGALEQLLTRGLLRQAGHQRACRIVDGLERLAVSHPAREHVRTILQILLSQPQMENVLLFRSFRGLMRSAPNSRLAPWVYESLVGVDPAGAVGLPPGTDRHQVREAVSGRLGELHQMAVLSLSAAEEDARIRLVPALQRVLTTL